MFVVWRYSFSFCLSTLWCVYPLVLGLRNGLIRCQSTFTCLLMEAAPSTLQYVSEILSFSYLVRQFIPSSLASITHFNHLPYGITYLKSTGSNNCAWFLSRKGAIQAKSLFIFSTEVIRATSDGEWMDIIAVFLTDWCIPYSLYVAYIGDSTGRPNGGRMQLRSMFVCWALPTFCIFD